MEFSFAIILGWNEHLRPVHASGPTLTQRSAAPSELGLGLPTPG